MDTNNRDIDNTSNYSSNPSRQILEGGKMINYTEEEKNRMISMFSIIHHVKKVKIKDNVYDILKSYYGEDEYNEDDKRYFESIKNQECIMYCFHVNSSRKEGQKNDWFILLDDNYCFIDDSFEILQDYI